jgi:hypothetical protein
MDLLVGLNMGSLLWGISALGGTGNIPDLWRRLHLAITSTLFPQEALGLGGSMPDHSFYVRSGTLGTWGPIEGLKWLSVFH